MNDFAPAERATGCTGKVEPGAKALEKYLMDRFTYAGTQGIYNCRRIRGGKGFSVHSEGRALDLRIPVGRGGRARPELGDPVVHLLAGSGRRLGIQRLIYNRRTWNAKAPNGRKYTGVNPHFDHVHIELTRNAARSLDLATLEAVLGDESRNEGKASLELIDAAFAAGWAQGKKQYWHDLPADSPEWADFWGACYRAAEQVRRSGKPAAAWIDAAFAAGWAEGNKQYWHDLPGNDPEWSDFWAAFTRAVG